MAALVAAGALGASLTGTQPARAETPWLTVSGGFAAFSIPADFVRDTMGSPSLLNVEGNFGPSANWSELGLSQFGNAWTATIGPLRPGAYYYRIAADDGRVVLKDPTNPTRVTSQPAWSTFFVPGDAAAGVADVPAVKGGALATLTYVRPGSGQERSATVWTPPGYDALRRQPYPVLYLLAPEAGGAEDWVELGRARQILDNSSAGGRAVPMVVVMGGGGSDSGADLAALTAAARHRYNIAREGAQQAIAGPSSAGSEAVRTALARPGEFGYVGSFAGLDSGAGLRLDARAINAGVKVLRLYTGNVTDPAYNPTHRLMRGLDRAGVRYEFDGVNPGLGHNWTAWQDDLADFLPRLFRPRPGQGPRTRGLAPVTCRSGTSSRRRPPGPPRRRGSAATPTETPSSRSRPVLTTRTPSTSRCGATGRRAGPGCESRSAAPARGGGGPSVR